jgi:putative membrane-bound dehydrogenase-like protein
MKRLALALVLLPLAAPWVFVAARPEAKPPSKAPANTVELNGHTFTLPPGFTIELVAGPPLVNRPIVADFDEQGRLYVADSSGSNDKVDKQLKDRPHRIVRLEDTDGDGRFDKATAFADKMMFPEGVMWLDGSLYVAAPPSIWKLTDTDGDGVADKREEWFKGKTLTGCANDLHGPYAGPDGFVYWCKGAFAQQTYERPGRKPFVTRAAHIFRCRPDGSGVEPVMTGGMDNPVDVVFTPGGERVFTTTFFQHPAGGQRDGLIHAVYGGVYGKEHNVLDGHARTAPGLMPVLTHLGPAAPAGLTRYESRAFGPDYQDNLFAALFNLQKVTRHVLTPSGATFTSRDSDFVVSSNRDFHPTDVVEDADGSLLVIDTGGWYKLCCPTSQLYKPDVLGAIYRVRKKGAPKVDDPRGLKIDWAKVETKELTKLLGDPRPAVRRRAVATLGKRGPDVVDELVGPVRAGPSVEAQRNAIWAVTRIDSPRARALVRDALNDTEETVRQVALHSISLWRDKKAVLVVELLLLKGKSAQNRRAAAEALGRIGEETSVPILLDALAKDNDRVLDHSLTYALVQIGDRKETAKGLKDPNPRVRRAALIALDQMEGGGLEPKAVAAELNARDAALRETAWWVVGRHPEWGGPLAGFLRDRLAAKDLSAVERDELASQLARFASGKEVQGLLAERLREPAASPPERQTVLRAMARSRLKTPPEAWLAALAQALNGGDPDTVREAVTTARQLPVPRQKAEAVVAALRKIGDDSKAPPDVRLAALAAVPGGLGEVPPTLFAFLREHLDREQLVAVRSLAAEVLAHAKLSREQLLALGQTLKDVSPMEVDRLLEALARTTDEAVGLAAVAALKASPLRTSLRAEAIKPRLAKFGPKVWQEAEGFYAALDADAAGQRARLEKLLGSVGKGDVRRGQAVFNGAKAACSSCHAVGYLGGKVGPDLTRIGAIRSERDLLESIVFPSASFVRGYEPVLVTTKAGRVVNGVLRKDAPDEIVLATGPNEEARIARADVEDIQPSKVSVMPAGLDQQLSPAELADLVAFLKACR